jgi:hypothetical protein
LVAVTLAQKRYRLIVGGDPGRVALRTRILFSLRVALGGSETQRFRELVEIVNDVLMGADRVENVSFLCVSGLRRRAQYSASRLVAPAEPARVAAGEPSGVFS